jgi:tryptophanyl-tRNA synthetase
MKKRMLSGVKPTGKPHIGNYFGSIKQFLDLQNSGNEVFAFVPNLHALISVQNKDEMFENTIDVVKDYIACGLDPDKVTLFVQSDIPEHSELNWIFNCLVTVPYMERAHAYKDAIANGKEPTVGLFDYPVLMAADILLYSPDIVPVGQDQKQHIEYARDIANKFHDVFCKKNENGEVLDPTFKLPEDYIQKEVAIVPGIDGRKMSKSYKNHIPLFATDEEIRKVCMNIVTDSAGVADKKNPDENHIYNIYKLFANNEEDKIFRSKLENGGVGYGDLKKELSEKIISFITPLREKRDRLTNEYILDVIKKGGLKAKKVAEEKMQEIRKKTGLLRTI